MYKSLILIMIFNLAMACNTKGQDIVYNLPKNVIEHANDYINKKENKNSKFIAQLSKQDDDKYILFIINYDFAGKEEFKLIEDVLIKRTSRKVRINKLLLPLILDEDILFADFGSEKMPDGRIARKKIVFTSESYPIKFDRKGNLF